LCIQSVEIEFRPGKGQQQIIRQSTYFDVSNHSMYVCDFLASFAGTLLSAAQSFPNLTASPAAGTSTTLTAAGQTSANVTSLSQALTMSLTSTSSDSDNDFLEMCRASTLLAELEDDEELPEPDEEMDDNEDDLKDDEDYDDVMVSAVKPILFFEILQQRFIRTVVHLATD
jgi:hypothetical protein